MRSKESKCVYMIVNKHPFGRWLKLLPNGLGDITQVHLG